MYYTYMLRCIDNSIYTGITNDIEKRMEEHFKKQKNCAKYTKVHTAKNVEAIWSSKTRSLASKLEYHIKKITKNEKEELIKLNKFGSLENKINIEEYKREKI